MSLISAGPLWLDRMLLHPTCGVPVLRSNIPVVASMIESTFIKALGTRLDLVKFTDFLLGAIAVPAKPMAAWNGTDFFDGDPSLAMLMDSYVADTIAALSAHSANGTWALATQWGGVTSQ